MKQENDAEIIQSERRGRRVIYEKRHPGPEKLHGKNRQEFIDNLLNVCDR